MTIKSITFQRPDFMLSQPELGARRQRETQLPADQRPVRLGVLKFKKETVQVQLERGALQQRQARQDVEGLTNAASQGWRNASYGSGVEPHQMAELRTVAAARDAQIALGKIHGVLNQWVNEEGVGEVYRQAKKRTAEAIHRDIKKDENAGALATSSSGMTQMRLTEPIEIPQDLMLMLRQSGISVVSVGRHEPNASSSSSKTVGSSGGTAKPGSAVINQWAGAGAPAQSRIDYRQVLRDTPFKVLLNESIFENSRSGDMTACDST